MESLSHLIAQLWTVLTARAQALSTVWKGFADFPDTLPRKVHASLWRELKKLESLLRRKILHDAHQIKDTLTPTPPKLARKKAASKTNRVKNTEDKAPPPHRIAPFRFDEVSAIGKSPVHAPRILSYNQIMAMPAPAQKPRAETLDTGRLYRRLESFYIALQETGLLARKLAQRLADNDLPRLKPFKVTKAFKPWARLFIEIDLIIFGVRPPASNLDSS